jgi:DNA-binding NtrC family response regulator
VKPFGNLFTNWLSLALGEAPKMIDKTAAENETLRLVQGGDTSVSQSTAAYSNKFEAIKILTRALFRELESLDEGSAQQVTGDISLYDEVHRFEAELIRSALISTGGRQRRAARLLKMSIGSLNSKIKRYKLDADEAIKASSNLRLKTR